MKLRSCQWGRYTGFRELGRETGAARVADNAHDFEEDAVQLRGFRSESKALADSRRAAPDALGGQRRHDSDRTGNVLVHETIGPRGREIPIVFEVLAVDRAQPERLPCVCQAVWCEVEARSRVSRYRQHAREPGGDDARHSLDAIEHAAFRNAERFTPGYRVVGTPTVTVTMPAVSKPRSTRRTS